MKKLWMLLLLLAFTLLLAGSAACGGDDDDDDSGSDPTADARDDGGDDEETDEPADDGDDDDGGGDGDYYNQLEVILDEADQESNAIAQQYGGPYDDAADEIEQTTSAFVETGAIIEGVAVTMSDLEPPSEAQDAHDSYIEALGTAAALFSEMVDELGDITTAEELSAFQDERGPVASAASDAIEERCLTLQGFADSAGSGADLGCTEQD